MEYNEELIGIIDKIQSNTGTTVKATHDSYRLPKHNLIDFDDCQLKHDQSTETTPSTSVMVLEGMSTQNVRFFFTIIQFALLSVEVRANFKFCCFFFGRNLQKKLITENADLKHEIQVVKRQKEGLEEVNKNVYTVHQRV